MPTKDCGGQVTAGTRPVLSTGTRTGAHLFRVTVLFPLWLCYDYDCYGCILFYFFFWSVSNSKRQKRQRHRHREWRRRGWLTGHRTWRDGHCSPHLFLVNTWKAEEVFQPFHPEKWNLRNKSRPAQLTLRSSPNSRDSRGGARVLTANLRSCCFRPSRIEVGCYCL